MTGSGHVSRLGAVVTVLLCLAFGGACELITGPDDDLRVSIEELRVTLHARDQKASVSGGDVVTLDGVTRKAQPCYELGARANVTNHLLGDDGLTIRVGAEYSRDRCGLTVMDVSASTDYQAEVAGLRPGAYRVIVIHRESWSASRSDTLINGEVVAVQ